MLHIICPELTDDELIVNDCVYCSNLFGGSFSVVDTENEHYPLEFFDRVAAESWSHLAPNMTIQWRYRKRKVIEVSRAVLMMMSQDLEGTKCSCLVSSVT